MTNCKKIFLTGGSGTLGAELIKFSTEFGIEFIAPRSKVCDVRSYKQLEGHIASSGCMAVLHSAAETDVKDIERSSTNACETNVVGTLNVMKICEKYNKKMIFISTDHVFDGEKGNYKTTDPLNPLTKYAKTKAAAELVVRTYENSLVIRTSFFGQQFPYPAAFADQWSSKDYVDIIAPKVLEAVANNTFGIVHVGSERKNLYEIAYARKKDVKKASRFDIKFTTPFDTSLEITNE
tara:strand:- start:80 stop:787 length:708 start_codon:yes stop_codon:yes gene_type:complete